MTDSENAFFKKKKQQGVPVKTSKPAKLTPQQAIEVDILNSLSFSTLNDDAQDIIYQYVRGSERPSFSNEMLFRNRQSMARALASRSDWLATVNPATFHFMSDAKKTALAQELYFVFYLLSAQYQLDTTEDRPHAMQERAKQLEACAELLSQLRLSDKRSVEANQDLELLRSINDSEKPVKYLGLTLAAPVLVEITEAFISTGNVREKMNEINGRRLYWVWGRSFVCCVLDLFSSDFANKPQAESALAAQGIVMGYMSWVLYYARAGMNWGLLLKHTIKGPWMNDAEHDMDISSMERFLTQWDQRKFTLLNDTIWATCNLACFYWLIGSGMMGWWGNVFTAALLLMDACIAVWQLWEQETRHAVDINCYEDEIDKLTQNIADLEDADEETLDRLLRTADPEAEDGVHLNEKQRQAFKEQQVAVLEEQLILLTAARDKCELDWQFKRQGLLYDLAYAVGLLVAFAALCCFFVLPGAMVPATGLAIAVGGAALCFVFNAIYSGFTGYIEVQKSQHAESLASQTESDYIGLFLKTIDKDEQRRLYLEIMHLRDTVDYQQQLTAYNQLLVLHGMLIEAIMPALVFSALVFLPLGIGPAVI